jgi:hypothetical protein
MDLVVFAKSESRSLGGRDLQGIKEKKKAHEDFVIKQAAREAEKKVISTLCSPSFSAAKNSEEDEQRKPRSGVETRRQASQKESLEYKLRCLEAFCQSRLEQLEIVPMIQTISNTVASDGQQISPQIVSDFLKMAQAGVERLTSFSLRSSFLRGTLKQDTGCSIEEIFSLLECCEEFFRL